MISICLAGNVTNIYRNDSDVFRRQGTMGVEWITNVTKMKSPVLPVDVQHDPGSFKVLTLERAFIEQMILTIESSGEPDHSPPVRTG